MFCIECGQPMADEGKFCAYCGTRRAVPAVSKEAVAPTSSPARPEAPSVAPPPAPARTIRSTAEIMPIRVQRPAPPPPIEEPPVEPEDLQHVEAAVPWRQEQFAPPSSYASPEPPVSQAQPSRNYVPPAEVSAPVQEGYRSVPFAAEPGSHDTDRRRISPVLIGAIAVALIAIAGIVWMVRSTLSFGGKTTAPVTITIYPTSAKVAAGKAVDFVAEVGGAPTSDVTWSVEEGNSAGEIKTRGASAKGDTISLYSTYSAPTKPGTYHLVATSTADKSKSATAEITVAGK